MYFLLSVDCSLINIITYVPVHNQMNQMVWTATPDGNVTYVNKKFTDYTGFSYEESVGPGWLSAVSLLTLIFYMPPRLIHPP